MLRLLSLFALLTLALPGRAQAGLAQAALSQPAPAKAVRSAADEQAVRAYRLTVAKVEQLIEAEVRLRRSAKPARSRAVSPAAKSFAEAAGDGPGVRFRDPGGF